MKTITAVAILSLALCYASSAYADTFGTDPNTTFEIEFVTIGNPGNPADTNGNPSSSGSVPYAYRIGKFEISEDMVNKANALGGLGITHLNWGDNKPAARVDWFEAAQFVNWLNTSTGNTPAYNFDPNGNFQLWDPNDAGYNPNNLFRNSLTKYVLPDGDEWYKAAYYDPNAGIYYDYPTGSDTEPTPVASGTTAGTAVYGQFIDPDPADITLAGGLSPYGTMGQGGNVFEWEETDFSTPFTPARVLRGGFWQFGSHLMASDFFFVDDPATESFKYGFRVASIPEPTTYALALAALCLVMSRRRPY